VKEGESRAVSTRGVGRSQPWEKYVLNIWIGTISTYGLKCAHGDPFITWRIGEPVRKHAKGELCARGGQAAITR